MDRPGWSAGTIQVIHDTIIRSIEMFPSTLSILAILISWIGFSATTFAAPSPEARSLQNQTYQFMAEGNGDIAAYLWIPENCRKVRGLLIFGQNVPEGLIAAHSAIRKACADNDLAIVFTSLSFWYYGDKEGSAIRGLQNMLNQLADKSGYPEIATVPWLPIGESMSRIMVKGVVDQKPERCIAAIYACDIDCGTNRTVPILGASGTSLEWEQIKRDIRTCWKSPWRLWDIDSQRNQTPSWPYSYMAEAGGGHFNCSEKMIQYFALYIDRAAKVRLSNDGSPELKPVDIENGFVAELPIKGPEPIEAVRDAKSIGRSWYFDRQCAEQAQAIASVNWNAETQVPLVHADDHCVVKPWSRNSVTEVEVRTDSEFSLKPYLLDKIPESFVAAGAPLAKSKNPPFIQLLRAPIAALGENRFCVDLDRNYKGNPDSVEAIAMVVAPSDDQVRYSVQPLIVKLFTNKAGAPQTIDFKTIDNVSSTTTSVPLEAKASSGLPVKFYVEVGPAIVQNNQLKFTKLPPNTKFPVDVTVIAWQWGTCEPPLFQGTLVRQTFSITK